MDSLEISCQQPVSKAVNNNNIIIIYELVNYNYGVVQYIDPLTEDKLSTGKHCKIYVTVVNSSKDMNQSCTIINKHTNLIAILLSSYSI